MAPANLYPIPFHIRALVQELEHWVTFVNTPGLSDGQAERYSLEETRCHQQLRAFGWDVLLDDESGHRLPAPPHFSIIRSQLGYGYFIQRCTTSRIKEQWDFLLEEESQDRRQFATWAEAYCFLFEHVAREQEQVSLKLYCVRHPKGWGGYDYLARSPEQAICLSRNDVVVIFQKAPSDAARLEQQAFEHRGDLTHFCEACHFYPCCRGLRGQWVLPSHIGVLAFPNHLPTLPEQMFPSLAVPSDQALSIRNKAPSE